MVKEPLSRWLDFYEGESHLKDFPLSFGSGTAKFFGGKGGDYLSWASYPDCLTTKRAELALMQLCNGSYKKEITWFHELRKCCDIKVIQPDILVWYPSYVVLHATSIQVLILIHSKNYFIKFHKICLFLDTISNIKWNIIFKWTVEIIHIHGLHLSEWSENQHMK